jgi:uncharacterized iron-regulated membrane protein
MIWLRKPLILAHRYLGIALSLMFVMWFVTGIGMIYSRGMPRLTPQVRLTRLAPVNLSSVKLSPAEAAERAGVEAPSGRVTLVSVLDRPIYRFGNSTVFADTGEPMSVIDADTSVRIGARFMGLPAEKVHFDREITEPDQWTLTLVRQLPLYKLTVDDSRHTELYLSPDLGEVVQVTTRGSRLLSWVSTIPHFLYFAPLRMAAGGVWVKSVVWTSMLACVLAVLGIVLGIVQLRKTRPHIRYSGWMRWHHVTGLVFGVLTLTWAFSGLLSMEPWAWTEQDEVESGVRQAFDRGALDLAHFPAFDAPVWSELLKGRALKEVELTNLLDEPHYIARTSPDSKALVGWPDGGHQPYFVSRDPDNARIVIAAKTLEQANSFAAEVLLNRLKQANPETAVVDVALLTAYDSYYYSRDGQAPLPVLRVQLDDPRQTWVYLDPEVAQVVGQANRFNRIERWLYNGLHTLDFSFLYYNRPIWDALVIALSLGGTAVSGIGLILGVKRLRRNLSW